MTYSEAERGNEMSGLIYKSAENPQTREFLKNISVYIGIAVFVVLNVLLYRYERRKKILKRQSEENNTFIIAHLIHSHDYCDHDSESHEREYYGKYKYTVNGKTKTYSTRSRYPLPDTIKMYPKNREGTKFFSDYARYRVYGVVTLNGIAAIAAGVATYLWAIHSIGI